MYPNLPSYPTYGTLEDTKEYVEKFIDPDYALHISMAKVLSDVTLRLSDSAILPFDLGSLIDAMRLGNATLTNLEQHMRAAYSEEFG